MFYRICVGEMGMSLTEFKEAPIKHLLWAIEGYQDKKFFDYKAGWEQSRFIGYMSISIAKALGGGKGKNISLQDILPFPWEKKEGEKDKPKYNFMKPAEPGDLEKYFSHLLEGDKEREHGAERRDD